MLLILTSREDLAADFLIVELIRRNMPYFRLNVEDWAAAKFIFETDQLSTIREIKIGRRSLDFTQIRSVWYRRAIHPVPSTLLPWNERVFVAGELRHLAMGLILNPDILWVNPIEKVSVGENKLFQLQLAKKLGFCTPRTIVSNDPSVLRKFVNKCEPGAICKPIFHGLFFDDRDKYSIYTRRILADSIDAAGVDACPILLQEEVERQSDIRVTFIADQCFVAEVHGNVGLIDWRDPSVSARFSPSQIDESTRTKCRLMLSELGLVYGAFDFIKRPNGELVFLEINPTGEWAWLEDQLDFPMRATFIRLFFGD